MTLDDAIAAWRALPEWARSAIKPSFRLSELPPDENDEWSVISDAMKVALNLLRAAGEEPVETMNVHGAGTNWRICPACGSAGIRIYHSDCRGGRIVECRGCGATW